MEEIKKEIQVIRESQIRTEEDIKTHIKRTNLLEDLHKDNAIRIGILEEPIKAKKYIKEALIDFGKFTSILLAVAGILKLLGKI